jgi:hypothetical protein
MTMATPMVEGTAIVEGSQVALLLLITKCFQAMNANGDAVEEGRWKIEERKKN